MILSDIDLEKELASGRLVVDPLGPNAIQPSSIDLRVGNQFRVFTNSRYPFIDVRLPMEDLTEVVTAEGEEPFILHPGEFVLGTTLERVEIPDDLVGRLDGKSSLGRLGLVIHATAGWADPGWKGHLTLELSNVANLPITLYPGMKIGQISLMRLSSPSARPYGSQMIRSKYMGQTGPTASRYWENFESSSE
jgi:dCTP deaminase